MGRTLAFCALGYAGVWLITICLTLGASFWAQQHYSSGERVAGINHFLQVDDQLWRGSAPSPDGYRELADRGIGTVIDLRAEDLTSEQLASPGEAGLDLVRMPIRDGQTPTEAQVAEFVSAVESAEGPVYVHCGAGVGRAGMMSAAYLVRTDQAGAREAGVRTLAVGPPSVEQIYYVFTADEEMEQPPLPIQAVSRVLDAPRRINASLDLF